MQKTNLLCEEAAADSKDLVGPKLKKRKKSKAKKQKTETSAELNKESGELEIEFEGNNETAIQVEVELKMGAIKSNNKKNKKKTATKELVNYNSTKSAAMASKSKLMGSASNNQCALVSEIAKAREHIKNSLEKMDGIATMAASPASVEVLDRLAAVEKDNLSLKDLVAKLQSICLESQKRITLLENSKGNVKTDVALSSVEGKKSEPADDDDVDLFGSESDEENAEAARLREERLSAYAAKKSKKPVLIAKSSLVLDVKPWDDETDLKVLETKIRQIHEDGLLWGASKFVTIAYGIQKLSISCVVEDEKISIDWLTEEIEKLEDYVQSVDVAAFNKI